MKKIILSLLAVCILNACATDPYTGESKVSKTAWGSGIGTAVGAGLGAIIGGEKGALVGAGMIVGLATKDRIQSRARMKEMMEKFQARNGATQCRLLKGIGTGKPLRDCPDCVADASEFLEEYL
jgi:hypothetical protein